MYEIKLNKSKYTNEELMENLKTTWDYHGRQVRFRDLNCYPSKISAHTYVNRYSTWNQALIEFSKFNGVIKEKTKTSKNPKSISRSLRFKIFTRDNFRCVVCGSSPATSTCVRLEVDHIVPISKNGSNDLSNLRTLCDKCNQGKKDQ